jgi:hypothetical protein
MLPVNFNLVMTGDNFPVQSISMDGFAFNHRQLRETMRLPLGINAETRGASVQVLPDRIQAAVVEVRNIDSDADHLTELIQPFFDYVGPKSIKAVGHNAQFILDAAVPKSAVSDRLLNIASASHILGDPPSGADIHLFLPLQNGSTLRMAFVTQTDLDQVGLEFNAHFELKGAGATDAVNQLKSSLRTMVDMAERAQASLQPQEVSS